jgi:peptide/nickel transport system permease protein
VNAPFLDAAQARPAVLRPGFAETLCCAWLLAVAACALAAPLLPLVDPLASDFAARLSPPGADHLLGTDQLGRDLFSRVAHGARVSLLVGVLAPLLGLLAGTALGIAAGYLRGRVEAAIVGAVDCLLAFPTLILVLAVIAITGPRLAVLIPIMGVLTVPAFTRIARATTASLAQRDFVVAARAIGASHARIMLLELAPLVAVPVAAYSLISMARIIVLEGVLSFLGLSVPPPAPTWGNMIAQGMDELSREPYVSLVPCAAMFLTILSINLLADRVRSATATRGSAL